MLSSLSTARTLGPRSCVAIRQIASLRRVGRVPNSSSRRCFIESPHSNQQKGGSLPIEEEVPSYQVSEKTLKKLDGLSEDEVNKKKSLVQVTANVSDGRSVVCYGGGNYTVSSHSDKFQ